MGAWPAPRLLAAFLRQSRVAAPARDGPVIAASSSPAPTSAPSAVGRVYRPGRGPRGSRASSRDVESLHRQELLLQVEEPLDGSVPRRAAVATERSVGGDDPVARHDDADRRAAHGTAGRPRRARSIHQARELAITGRGAPRDPGHGPQDTAAPL